MTPTLVAGIPWWYFPGLTATAEWGGYPGSFGVPADGNLCLLFITHTGAGNCVPPVGWTQRFAETDGTRRWELWWKWAASEPDTYLITGLGGSGYTTALTLQAFGNMVGSGDPFIGSIVTRKAAASYTMIHAAPTTTGPRQALLHWFGGLPASYVGTNSFALYYGASASVFPGTTGAGAPDIQLWRGSLTLSSGGVTPAGSLLYDVKERAGFPGYLWVQAPTGSTLFAASVVIQGQPDPATVSRYYLTHTEPRRYPAQLPETGTWGDLVTGETAEHAESQFGAFELNGDGLHGGVVTHNITSTNRQHGRVRVDRWVTPPLAAQTISGTLNFVGRFGCAKVGDEPGSELFGPAEVRMAFHVVVVDQAVTTVKQVLVADYTDSAIWTWVPLIPGYTAIEGRTLATPMTLSATIDAGDRILIDRGVEIEIDPWPTPLQLTEQLRKENYWNIYASSGSQLYTSNTQTSSELPAGDDVVGYDDYITPGRRAAYFQFSAALTELGIPIAATPTNESAVTALPLVVGTPWAGIVDGRSLTSGARRLYWQWTAPTSGWHTFRLHGSGYPVAITFAPFDYGILIGLTTAYWWANGNQGLLTIDATAGETYVVELSPLIRQSSFSTYSNQNCYAGGYLRLELSKFLPLADDDVIVAAHGVLARYTKTGVLAHVDTAFLTYEISGLAIDYSLRPVLMGLIGDGDQYHTAPRLLVALFGLDIVYLLDLETFSSDNSGIAFYSLYDGYGDNDPQLLASLAADYAGNFYAGWFGSGFTWAVSSDNTFLYTPARAGTADIVTWDVATADSNPPWDPVPRTRFTADVEAGGTNYIEFTPDGQELWYASGRWYVPAGGTQIKHLQVGPPMSQLADHALVPLDGDTYTGIKGLFPLPDGGCLVCTGAKVQRTDAGGAVVQTYIPTPAAYAITDVEIQRDSLAFWTFDWWTLRLYQFDPTTGEQLRWVESWLPVGTSTSLVVVRSEPGILPPIPPVGPVGCPTDLLLSAGSDLSGCPSDLTEIVPPLP